MHKAKMGAESRREGEPKPFTREECMAAVCHTFNVSREDLKGASREQYILWARHTVTSLMCKHTGDSLSRIGRELGGRDHSTVINAERRTEELLGSNADFRDLYLRSQDNLRDGVAMPSARQLELELPARQLVTEAIARGEVHPIDVLEHQAVGKMRLLELLVVLPYPDSPTESAEEPLQGIDHARLVLLQAGIREERVVENMSPVERDSLYMVLESMELLRKQ